MGMKIFKVLAKIKRQLHTPYGVARLIIYNELVETHPKLLKDERLLLHLIEEAIVVYEDVDVATKCDVTEALIQLLETIEPRYVTSALIKEKLAELYEGGDL